MITVGNRVGIGARHGSVLNQYDSHAQALFDRMVAAGETPDAVYKKNIDDTIKALKSHCLFENRFDAIWIGRGHGEASTKLNWIKDSHNLEKVGAGTLTFTDGVGYHSDGSTSYLKTNYTPSSQGVNIKLTDAGVFLKLGGVTANGAYHYFSAQSTNATCDITIGRSYANKYDNLMNGNANKAQSLPIIGYNGLGRISPSEYHEYKGTNQYTNAATSGAFTTREMYILAQHNYTGGVDSIANVGAIFEIAAIGAYYTQAEFLIMQSIFNTFISSL